MRGGTYTLIREREAVAEESDAEGVPILTEDPDRKELCGCSVMGITASEARRAAQFGQDVAAIAGVPNGSDLDHRDRIIIDADLNPCAQAEFLGAWEIAAILPRPTRLRVYLRRNYPTDEPGD